MIERLREVSLAGFVVALVLVALAIDLTTDDVRPPAAAAPATGFFERAVYCPPSPFKGGSSESLTVAPATTDTTAVSVQPLRSDPIEIEPAQQVTVDVRGTASLEAVGYGGPVRSGVAGKLVTTIEKQGAVDGIAAATCALSASSEWYLPAGSSVIGNDENLLIANPFPSEAVVKVFFVTSRGQEASSELSDVAVPPGASVRVDLSDAALPTDALGVRLAAERGRVVAWKGLLTKVDDQPSGYALSLGAPGPATSWYFPHARIDDGAKQVITIMNPNEREAGVSITLERGDRVVQASRLLEIVVPPLTNKAYDLSKFLDKDQAALGEVSALVRVNNDVPVVAESTVMYGRRPLRGVTTEVGATEPHRRWLVAPAAASADKDVLAFMNPGNTDATVDVSFFTEEGEARTPEEMQGLIVPSGLRLKLPVAAATGGRPLMARVTADAPIVVGRFAYSSKLEDVADVIGQPAGRLEFGELP
ncbi:MAG: DUF5719 family protein [Actinomycetota bacterium]